MGKFVRILAACLLSAGLLSCTKDGNFDAPATPSSGKTGPDAASRSVVKPHGRVMLLYSAGFHNLSAPQKTNIAELEQGFLPRKLRNDNVLLVFARNTTNGYDKPVSPVLIRLSRSAEGKACRDTVKTWPEETLASDPGTFHDVLAYVKDQYPAEQYGVVFSSHGTGWLPQGYYSNASSYNFEDVWSASRRPYRSAGMDVTGTGAKQVITEMDIEKMAAAIPMHLDYFLFDACLMGCVEVAYAFRDKVSVMGFSPTEVLSEGFDYTKMAELLLGGEAADPTAVCRTYLEKYLTKTGSYKSASTAVVDLRHMDEVAAACANLFSQYRQKIASVRRSSETVESDGQRVTKYTPQNYYTGDHRWFYDLRDILVTAGIPNEDLAELDRALAKTVLYEGHTPNFLVTTPFLFHSCSGMSMFLPSDNTDKDLASYYRTLSWNKATGLIP